MSQPKVKAVEKPLSFEELRTSIDALCEHYLEGSTNVIAGDICCEPSKDTSQQADNQHAKKEDPEKNTDENKNFVFSRILQKIVNFYTQKLFHSANTKNDNAVNTENSCDNNLSNFNCNKETINDAEGHAKCTADDTLEYAFTSEDADVLLLLKTKDRTEHSENLELPVQQIIINSENGRMRVALSVLFRLLLPLFDRVSRGWHGLRAANIVNVLSKLRNGKGLLTTLLAYAANTVSMSLSSVQVANRIDPLLRVIKLRRNPSITNTPPNLPGNCHEAPLLLQPSTITQTVANIEESPPPSCVTCVVLTEPPADQPIRADVIFIHGLHGSLVNTWKQGLWNSEGKKVNIKRPPKPPVRPPKRPRRSRSTLIIPSKTKRPRFTDTFQDNQDRSGSEEDERFVNCSTFETESAKFTYECEAPSDTDFVDDVEYSFPTFRLRVEDIDSDSIEGSKLISDQAKRKAKCKKDENWSACWPKDWLPLDCPGVRVIALNYTTDPYLWRPTWVQKQNRTSLADRAREMTDMLIEKKVGQGHPIIWVGHSKGGIFIKQILVDAWDSGRAATQPLWQNSRGTLFYSVPHRGSPLADFKLPLLHQSIELTEIQKNCSGVLELHRKFVALYRGGHLKIDVFSFVETALTLMSVLYLRIVGVDSADPGIGEVCGVHLDHREICKPRERSCILYTELVKMINKTS